MKKHWLLLSALFALMLVLAACSSDEKPTTETGTETEKETETETETETEGEATETVGLPSEVKNDGDAITGGTLQVGLVQSSPFAGVFLAELYEDGYDYNIMEYSLNSIFSTDENFLITDDGIAKLEVDPEAATATVTIQGDYKWSDGTPLTADDLIYPYEIIGHPDYTGVRYDGDFQNIIGAVEYNAGTAKTISGIEKIDDKSIKISFTKLSPAVYSGGDGLWGSAAPKHQLESIAIADLLASDAVRKNPVTLGAFKYDKIVSGESVQMVANEYYYKGKPKVDKVVLQVVAPTSVAEALKAGQFDIVTSYPANQYEGVKDLTNISVLGRPELAYSYLGFKLGKYDATEGINIFDETSKMNDQDLRYAIAYAMDIETVGEKFYLNLRSRANSLMPPVFSAFYDDSLEGFHYDPAKANELLDAAGYKDVNADGIREGKDGKPFSINLAGMAGSDTDEAIAEYYRQNWKAVGLNVEFTTGRLIEFQSFYDKVKADDPEIDMFMAAWGTGTNPSPAGLYEKEASFNYSRFVSDELTALLDDIDSPAAMDASYRSKAFRAWQEYMSDTSNVIPMYFRTEIIPVNKRVKNYNVNYGAAETELQEIELVADAPIK